jgi:hypothetical protein
MEEENNKIVYKCLWCPCFFFTLSDLRHHMVTARDTTAKPGEAEHRVWWAKQLYWRDHEYINNG